MRACNSRHAALERQRAQLEGEQGALQSTLQAKSGSADAAKSSASTQASEHAGKLERQRAHAELEAVKQDTSSDLEQKASQVIVQRSLYTVSSPVQNETLPSCKRKRQSVTDCSVALTGSGSCSTWVSSHGQLRVPYSYMRAFSVLKRTVSARPQIPPIDVQARVAEAAVQSLEKDVKRLQEEKAARSADLTSQIAALTAEKAAVERRMAAKVCTLNHPLHGTVGYSPLAPQDHVLLDRRRAPEMPERTLGMHTILLVSKVHAWIHIGPVG